MPKQRLTGLDIHALSSELQSLVTYRLQNIYDINSRIFLLKFALPDSKRNVLVESGFRIHLTNYSREKSSSPSHFVAKLRKFLKTRRLTSLFQIGTDRILVLSFHSETNEEKSYHLVFEFFSAGNIILVASNYKILHVLRTFRPTVPEGGDLDAFQTYEVGAHYSVLERHFSSPREYEAMTIDRLRKVFMKTAGKEEVEEEEVNALMPQGDHSDKQSLKKQKGKNTLRKALLSGASEYGAQLVEEIIRSGQIDGNTFVSQIPLDESSPILQSLLKEFQRADEIIQQCSSPTIKSYITATPQKDSKDLLYQDFMPFAPTALPPTTTTLEYDSFNLALDTFFSHAEATRLQTKYTHAQTIAHTRLSTAQKDHAARLTTLRQTQELNVLKATLLENNLDRVEEALRSVNGLLARGMDWGDLERLIAREREVGNGVAEIIVETRFKEGKMVVGLREEEDEDEEEGNEGNETGDEEEEREGKKDVVKIEVDLGLSAWANAREYFDRKKVAAEKESRTAQSSSKALKNAERKITADLKRSLKEEKPLMKTLRETRWFEKFYWFISSEGYLVLGARDGLQSELLVRKYFRKGDVFVHSDLEGSSIVIVKNPVEDAVIPPGTLNQAGVMAIATSRAWDAKQVTSAWWVPYSQVQRREGGWEVKGKKNFLPPAMLVLGYAILWTTEDEGTMKRHARPLLTESSQVNADLTVDEGKDSIDEGDAALEEIPDEASQESEAEKAADTDEKGNEVRGDKYNLEEYGSASEEEPVTPEPGTSPPTDSTTTKQFLSAKQRRDRKKGSKPDASKPEDMDQVALSISNMSVSKTKSGQQIRGKKGKMKKIKTKYAEQSDDERELARKLLGAKAESARIPSASSSPPPQLKEEEKSIVKPVPRPAKPIIEESLEDLDLSLKELISAPKPSDIISDAVAVCAPWSALTRYKYKVKLTPGSTKKGKAARAIISGFLSMSVDEKGEDEEKMSLREKELLSSLKDEDIIPCIWPKSVKVVGGKVDSGKGGKKTLPAKGKGKK